MIKLKIISMLLLGVILFSAVSTVSAASNTIYEEKQLTVNLNEKFTIKLTDISGSSGYAWKTQYDHKFIKLVSENIVFDKIKASDNLCGTKIYVFKALKKGQTRIVMTQSRPWSNETPSKIIFYNIKIQ